MVKKTIEQTKTLEHNKYSKDLSTAEIGVYFHVVFTYNTSRKWNLNVLSDLKYHHSH